MPTMKQIREGLATNLRAIDGVQVSEKVLASPTPPAIDMTLERIVYHEESGGGRRYFFSVQAIVTSALAEGAQELLDEFVDSEAVPDSIEDDATLGGVVDDTVVRELTNYGRTLIEGTEFFVARWQVEVIV